MGSHRRTGARFRQIVSQHLIAEKRRLIVAAACLFGYLLSQLLVPWPMKIVIDHVLLHRPLRHGLEFIGPLLQSGDTLAIMVVSSTIVVLAGLRGVFTYAQLYITSRIGFELVHRLRRELFGHVQRLSLSFHDKTGSGELLTKVTADTNTLATVFSDAPLTFVAETALIVGMLVIMYLLNWQLSLIPIITFPVLFLSLYYLFGRIKATSSRQRTNEGKLASRLSETLSAVALVQAFGQSENELRRFERDSAQSLEHSIRSARMEAAATRTVEIVGSLGLSGVVLVGSFQVLHGHILPGELLVFAGYMSNMSRPVRNMAKLLIRFSKAAVSAERISGVLEVEPDIQDRPHAIVAPRLAGHIVFDNVSFDYRGPGGVLRGASFTILPGQHVALIGASGAGKSTIIRLLMRYYDPSSGQILIDGIDIRDYQLDSLRRNVGVVLQDSLLFAGTVRENIAYGRPHAASEDIVRAAQSANAHDFILRMADGYATVISEQGKSLSGGQRQRIAIARTMLLDTPVLILDEPLRGLDDESRDAVQAALEELTRGRTSFLVTHDARAAARADLTLTLANGRIQERHGIAVAARAADMPRPVSAGSAAS